MRIAVVGPSPVPFQIGGMENLMWSVCDYINQKTSHRADLIKIPVRENDFWSLVESYYSFYKMDLSQFDAVICSKYPAWMVKHDNVIVYMAHRLRGLYDTYHLMNLPYEVEDSCSYVNDILDYMKKNPKPKTLDTFFEMVFALKGQSVPPQFFQFPGPFIKKLLEYMDDFGMSYSGRKKFYSISETVKKRTEYFPEGSEVQVLYPESTMTSTKTGEFDYVFMISRLDVAKRIDLLIKAMKHVKTDVHLKIAGTGPCEKELKELAAGDPRIEFLGFVNDSDVPDLYANCLCVPYFPYDEDYGYITAEAMLHSKPVITTADSGGPTEFVVNGETGFVVDTDEEEIAKAIDALASDKENAARMGANAYEKVKDISWENTVKVILEDIESQPKYKKLALNLTFDVYPVRGGGQSRIYNLYKALGRYVKTNIVNIVPETKTAFDGNIAKNLHEKRFVMSGLMQDQVRNMSNILRVPSDDTAMMMYYSYNPDFVAAMRENAQNADAIVLAHPYLINAVEALGLNKPIIFEAQDVNYLIKKEMYGTKGFGGDIVEKVFEAEKKACEISSLIITCSEKDRNTLHELYGTDMNKMVVVPNGVDTDEIKFVPESERALARKESGVNFDSYKKVAMFIGSWHRPNIDAAEFIVSIAEECPDTCFLFMGSVCNYFRDKKIPSNVGMLGVVEDSVKDAVYRMSDIALNPMFSGSGTNIKMFDYMASGLPIITTEFGARGIDDMSGFIVAEKENFAKAINDFVPGENSEMILRARKIAEDVFDWKVISDIYYDAIINIAGVK